MLRVTDDNRRSCNHERQRRAFGADKILNRPLGSRVLHQIFVLLVVRHAFVEDAVFIRHRCHRRANMHKSLQAFYLHHTFGEGQ
ncbi:hypothetical protein SRABI106_01986 [Rahnella aquatilis]|nr:hypothetical protein SRABI106_01986 [Rahnella aquatilis]